MLQQAGPRHTQRVLCTLQSCSLETEFLQYLEEWENAVQTREGVTTAQRKSMLLSVETLTGLKLTGMQTHINHDYV